MNFKFRIFSPEQQLASAVAGFDKFINKFEAAATMASKEIESIETTLSKDVDKFAKAIEDAYAEYMKAEIKYNEKTEKAVSFVEDRKKVLADVVTKASTTVENFRRMYSS